MSISNIGVDKSFADDLNFALLCPVLAVLPFGTEA
jgi:hypothetical protein